MKCVSRICVCLSLACAACFAQASQPPLTANQLTYFRYLLTTLGDPGTPAVVVEAHKSALPHHFGLSEQELGTILSASQEFGSVLQQLQSSANSIVAGKSQLIGADAAALTALSAARDSAIESLANRIINAVRPETADRLRAPGDLVASVLARKGN